ncbi:nucleoside hydrolase [Desulfosporosinus shakirovi]|uniref:nucleoside hydrolase n=1 Tax=Desulfosporosinus shakirovi TaxID=2885154 RepID=UPI001E54705D|nr:nucleoside hydrolase [Desulfosporosinus sp. SRJS8]MCB8814816.1 nucleoside hydrolase [Desulfosporosinus sp. SRJS8]
MTRKIIFDCDNTMGVKGCDVDDGLALLYLLGQDTIEICGITTTYGNSDVETVFSNTTTMLQEIGREDIRVLKGCPNRYNRESDAVNFIVETVNSFPGDISILATGSLTNIYSAYIKDHNLFAKISEIVMMGGITEKLSINGKIMDELNFSCDPTATEWILKEGNNISILTGNNCLDAFFPETDLNARLENSNNPFAYYIKNKCMCWFKDMMAAFNIDGFYNWDVVAAAFLVHPELFIPKPYCASLNPKDLERGLLKNSHKEAPACCFNTPYIRDINAFNENIYNSWMNMKANIKISQN